MTSYYELLGVRRDASQEELQAAMRRQMREIAVRYFGVPPDGSDDEVYAAVSSMRHLYRVERELQGEEKERFNAHLAELRAATETLTDPARRQAYDATLDPTGFPAASNRGAVLREPEQPTWGGYVPSPTEVRRRHTWNPIEGLTQNLPRGWRIAIDWVVTIVGAVGIVLLIKAYVVNPYRIPSSSMEPTLHCARPAQGCLAHFSDRVLANRFIYHFRDPRRGEIIVFKTPTHNGVDLARQKCGAGGTFVKRLIGLPGETLEEKLIGGKGYIFINGGRLDEPYVKPDRRDSMTYGPFKIPEGDYFMMGDNRIQSCDSREWGPVPRKNLIGEVFFVYWPPQRIGFR